jgi:hypothetical protein
VGHDKSPEQHTDGRRDFGAEVDRGVGFSALRLLVIAGENFRERGECRGGSDPHGQPQSEQRRERFHQRRERGGQRHQEEARSQDAIDVEPVEQPTRRDLAHRVGPEES